MGYRTQSDEDEVCDELLSSWLATHVVVAVHACVECFSIIVRHTADPELHLEMEEPVHCVGTNCGTVDDGLLVPVVVGGRGT